MLVTFIRLGRYARNHWLKILAAMGAVLISTAMGLLPPWLIRYGIDNLILQDKFGHLWLLGLLMILTALVKGVFDFLKSYISEYVAQNIIHDIRINLYKHLNKLSFSFYDRSRTGDLMSRVTADADTLRHFLGRASIYVSSNILTILGILGVMFIWDYRLGVLYILMLPLMIFGMSIYAVRVRPMFRKVRKKFAVLTQIIQENFVGMEVIKLFGQEQEEEKVFNQVNRQYIDTNLAAARVSAIWMPYVNFVMGLATALVIWYGGRLVIYNLVSFGTLAGFTSYIAMLLRPIRQTGMMINFSSQAAAAAERIFEVIDTPPTVQDAPDARELPAVKGQVEYQDVSFSYQNNKRVLNDINLSIQSGQTVAIVGPTGSGKSTLLHLLPRFYDPDRGRILIDGYNIKKVTLDSLRQQVGIVLQHTFLFAASIKENISYGRPEAGMDEIREAARIAQIHDFITDLPLGYETPVGERGVNLSGGQRQRLAMARVLLTDPALLILDEPTSSVDAETEDRMQQALERIIKDRTTFVIAHRLWTVKNSDLILVLQEGEIIERGTHNQLVNNSEGFYRQVYDNVLKENDAQKAGDWQ
ncbi:MAG: ABC transporter ATP-binding protein [Halanaerobiales bacterium]